MSSFSIPVLAVPALTVLSLIPHTIGRNILRANNCIDSTNPNGSATNELAKKKLSMRDYARVERFKSCSANHAENLPLFAFTILAGLLAESKTGTDLGVTRYAITFLSIRVLYTLNYMSVESKTWSYVRSLLFVAGLGVTFKTLYDVARVLA